MNLKLLFEFALLYLIMLIEMQLVQQVEVELSLHLQIVLMRLEYFVWFEYFEFVEFVGMQRLVFVDMIDKKQIILIELEYQEFESLKFEQQKQECQQLEMMRSLEYQSKKLCFLYLLFEQEYFGQLQAIVKTGMSLQLVFEFGFEPVVVGVGVGFGFEVEVDVEIEVGSEIVFGSGLKLGFGFVLEFKLGQFETELEQFVIELGYSVIELMFEFVPVTVVIDLEPKLHSIPVQFHQNCKQSHNLIECLKVLERQFYSKGYLYKQPILYYQIQALDIVVRVKILQYSQYSNLFQLHLKQAKRNQDC